MPVDPFVLREQVQGAGLSVVWRADQRTLAATARCALPAVDAQPQLLRSLCHVSDDAHVAIEMTPGAPPLVVVRRVEGVTLARRLPLDAAQGCVIVIALLHALAQAHAAGVVHGGLTPAHVVLGPRGLVSITDNADPDAAHLAPEVIAGGAPTVASDIYAVGVILHEVLTGAPLFAGTPVIEALAMQRAGLVPPPSITHPDHPIPPAIERVLLRALQRKPSGRYPDALAFAEALDGARLARARGSIPPPMCDETLWD